MVAGSAALALMLAGCGQGVARGGENAAEHPALGIFVPTTVGAGNISGHPSKPLPVSIPSNRAPAHPPAGQAATVAAVEAALTGGCWQNAHAGSVYGAYDQYFWWEGECAGTIGDQVTVEVFPSEAQAAAAAHHPSPAATAARFLGHGVLVSVFTSAPSSVVSQLTTLKSQKAVSGYGG
jgi:hypothetical protein